MLNGIDILCVILVLAISVHQYVLILHNVKEHNPSDKGINIYQTFGIVISLSFISNEVIKKLMIVFYGLLLCILFTYIYLYQLKYGEYHDVKHMQKNLMFLCIAFFSTIMILLFV